MPGPHGFAVRETRARQSRARVHRIPRPTSVTIAKRPSFGLGTGFALLLFLPNQKARNFLKTGWTGRQISVPAYARQPPPPGRRNPRRPPSPHFEGSRERRRRSIPPPWNAVRGERSSLSRWHFVRAANEMRVGRQSDSVFVSQGEAIRQFRNKSRRMRAARRLHFASLQKRYCAHGPCRSGSPCAKNSPQVTPREPRV
jgi:hypothetical protein